MAGDRMFGGPGPGIGLTGVDLCALKERLLKAIEEVRAMFKSSREEAVHCLNVQLFSL